MNGDTPPEIWRFALALYRAPGVADACLALQDRHGADVVLLIGLCWLAWRDSAVCDAAQIAELDAALAGWRAEIVLPLRALRRRLKPRLADLPASASAARDRIKDAELAGERVALDLFAAAADRLGPSQRADSSHDAALRTLRCYIDGLDAANRAETAPFVRSLAVATDGLDRASFA
jgi:uncharacterized protein (TIGR02444 family)